MLSFQNIFYLHFFKNVELMGKKLKNAWSKQNTRIQLVWPTDPTLKVEVWLNIIRIDVWVKIYLLIRQSSIEFRIGKTLLIDDFDVHQYLLRRSATEWEWLRRYFMQTIMEEVRDFLLFFSEFLSNVLKIINRDFEV